MLVLCLLVSQADAQLPFFKKKPPPEPEGPTIITVRKPGYESDVSVAADCIYAHEVFLRGNDLKKTQRSVIDYENKRLENCLRATADEYSDPAAFREDARQRALARFPPPPPPPVAADAPVDTVQAVPPTPPAADDSKSAPRTLPAAPAPPAPKPRATPTPVAQQRESPRVQQPSTDPFVLRTRQGPDYDLPESGPIVAAIKGKDALDTAARRVAAAEIFFRLPEFLTGTTGSDAMPPKLAKRHKEYLDVVLAERRAIEGSFAPCTGDDCPRRRYFNATWGYEFDEAFLAEVLATVRPDIRSAYMAYKAKISNPQPAEESSSAASSPSAISGWLDTAWTVLKWGLGIFGVVGFLALIGRGRGEPGPPPLTNNFGSASFAKPAKDIPRAAFRKGVFLGKASIQGIDFPPSAPFAPVFTTQERHTLIVAPTRSGKGTSVIIPTLLRYGGSMLTIDPKGENAAITARARQVLGQTIHIVNPWRQLAKQFVDLGFPNAATYNPLDVLERDDPNAVAIAQSLAETISPTTDASKSFWSGNAANLLAAVFLWLAEQPGETKTLARARHIVSLSRKEFTEKHLTGMMASQAFDHAIAEMVRPLYDLADDTYSGIVSTVSEATKFLSDPQVKESTSSSSFSMTDLLEGNTTVYLVIPPDRMHTHRTWLRLVLTAALQSFKRHRLRFSGGRCMFLIDEFAALGRIDDIPREIATISGYGLDMTLAVQGLDQLKANYGEAEAATILNNCAWKWFCNIGDKETAKYLSESLGKKTIQVKSKGHTTGQTSNRGGGGSSSGESTTWSETSRDLLTPDEILTLGRNFAIAFQPKGKPLFLRTVDYWNLQTYFAHQKDKHPGLWWVPPLNYDPNPYPPGQEEEPDDDERRQQEKARQEKARQEKAKQDQSKHQSRGGEQKSQSGGGGHSGNQGGSSGRSRNGRMTPEEARAVLEVGPNATPTEIRTAYKRLMAKVHPDKGGSNYLAKMLNEARSVLLGE